jgi:DNA-binding LytR/AlgR family response regulator
MCRQHYLLEPIDAPRLRQTLTHAHDRLERTDWRATRAEEAARVEAAVAAVGAAQPLSIVRRIPVRRRDDIVFVPVEQVASVVADAYLVTLRNGQQLPVSRIRSRVVRDHLLRL